MSPRHAVACIGGGLIGGGWAARFVLSEKSSATL